MDNVICEFDINTPYSTIHYSVIMSEYALKQYMNYTSRFTSATNLGNWINSLRQNVSPILFHNVKRSQNGSLYIDIPNIGRMLFVARTISKQEIVYVVQSFVFARPSAMKITPSGANNINYQFKGNKIVGLVDNNNHPLFPNMRFEYIDFFRNGFLLFKANGKFNYLKMDGMLLFKTWFDKAESFDADGYARVTINGIEYFVDTNRNLYNRGFNTLNKIIESRKRVNKIRLTESEFHTLISECVRKILKQVI